MAWTKTMPERPVVAVAGATGAVGIEMLKVLEQRGFPASRVVALASSRSAGKRLPFGGGELVVEEMTEASFEGVDIALFSAGAGVSKQFRDAVTGAGCVMIDNSSAFRMDDDVPLVVPEVNPGDVALHSGVIANPNCSTIQAMVALKPLAVKYGLKRVIYSTYQAVSGAGMKGYSDLENGLKGIAPQKFPHPIAGNCLPHIDVFLENGYTKEEQKMVDESRKILDLPNLRVTATTVRVPVFHGHSESINVEFEKPFELADIRALWEATEGIVVQDDPANNIYPMAITAADTDPVYVGRLRRDFSVENGINFWCVADNIRKGAATNAVQIAQELIRQWEA